MGESEFLEDEKKKDPVERMVNMLERMLPKPTAGSLEGFKTVAEAARPAATAIMIQLRKIENGFILGVQEQGYGPPSELYIQDPVALKDKVASVAHDFAQAAFQAYPPMHGVDAFKDDPAVGS